MTRSTNEGGCRKFSPVLGGGGTARIPSVGDIYDKPPNEMSSVEGKLVDHVGDHVVLSPEGTVLVMASPGMETTNPSLPAHSLNDSSSCHECLLLIYTRA